MQTSDPEETEEPKPKRSRLIAHYQGDEDCSICLSALSSGGPVAQTPCKHHFHAACIDGWLDRGEIDCPICRRALGTSGITVVIRGIAMPPFPLRSMRIVQDAVARAMSAFDDKFSAYCFRWPLAMSPDKVLVRCEGSPVSMRRPLQELVAQSDTGACRLEVEMLPDERWIPNADFQWGLLTLDRPRAVEHEASHPSMNEYAGYHPRAPSAAHHQPPKKKG